MSRKHKIKFDLPPLDDHQEFSSEKVFCLAEINSKNVKDAFLAFQKIKTQKKGPKVEKKEKKVTFLRGVVLSLTRSLTAIALGSVAIALVACYILWRYGRDLPDYYFLKNYQPASITKIYDRFGQQIKEFAEERRVYIPLSDVPSRLARAFIAAEDKNFYSHFGIDFMSFLKAVFINTLRKSWKTNPIGASTITQQVAKIFLVGNERSLDRKIKEAILAFRLEHALGKDRILELYINQIYLGASSYGVAMAAQSYFDKSMSQLSIAECALLASLPKAPSQQDPFKNPERSIQRRNWILKRMKKNQLITPEECETASKEPLIIYKNFSQKPFENSYFLEEVRRELLQNYGEKCTYRSGLDVTTTMHPEIQKMAEKALREGLERYDQRHGWRGPIGFINLQKSWKAELKKFTLPSDIDATPALVLKVSDQGVTVGLSDGIQLPLNFKSFLNGSNFEKIFKNGDVILIRRQEDQAVLFQVPKVTGGVVVLDAETGAVLGLDGGYAFSLSQFNCATQAWRQPASTFKPFVYLAALEHGFTTSSTLQEKPVVFSTLSGPYAPHNYNRNSYGGYMSLYTGLTKSRNVFTAILAQKVGVKNVIEVAKRMGISDYFPNEIVTALGTVETTVLRMASAFSPFFNGGFRVEPTLFTDIKGLSDQEKPAAYEKKDKKERVIAQKYLNPMKSMLAGVITTGTGKALSYLMKQYPIKIYGKTGTSSDFKDAWFVGCIELKEQQHKLENTDPSHLSSFLKHPLIFSVFVGFPTPKSLGQHEGGAKVALPIAECFIKQLYSSLKVSKESKEDEEDDDTEQN